MPDKTDADGDNALTYAIQSKCLTTINLLAPVTQKNLGGALYCLAMYKIELKTEELRQLVERAAQDRKAVIRGLEGAFRFGSSVMVEMIARQQIILSLKKGNKVYGWRQSSQTARQKSRGLLPNPPLEAITLQGERGVCGG